MFPLKSIKVLSLSWIILHSTHGFSLPELKFPCCITHQYHRCYRSTSRSRAFVAPRAAPIPDGPQPLIPERDPSIDLDSKVSTGITYREFLQLVDRFYPPNELEQRNAQSRTDGYWKYIKRGENPPEDKVYGEFDLFFLSQLLDKASAWTTGKTWNDRTFVDLGSGTGRLVLAASLLCEWKLCRGVEILESIHTVSNETLSRVVSYQALSESDDFKLAPMELEYGDFSDPNVYFGDADLVFCFSSCIREPSLLASLAESVCRQCRVGTIVVTIDYPLPLQGSIPMTSGDESERAEEYRMRIIEQIDGWCWLTGGLSTAFIHSVEKSLAQPKPLVPIRNLQDEAGRIIRLLESGNLTDTTAFIRNVYNQMVFDGFPDSMLVHPDSINPRFIRSNPL